MSDIFNHEADAWESLIDGEDEPCNAYPKPVACRYCGERGLSWGNKNGAWRLYGWRDSVVGLELHSCKAYTEKASEERKWTQEWMDWSRP